MQRAKFSLVLSCVKIINCLISSRRFDLEFHAWHHGKTCPGTKKHHNDDDAMQHTFNRLLIVSLSVCTKVFFSCTTLINTYSHTHSHQAHSHAEHFQQQVHTLLHSKKTDDDDFNRATLWLKVIITFSLFVVAHSCGMESGDRKWCSWSLPSRELIALITLVGRS